MGSGVQTGVVELPIDEVVPNPNQPRTVFDEDDLLVLADSIASIGLLQPVVVLPGGPPHVLLVGERRVRAARLAGLATVTALVRETEPEDEIFAVMAENLNRVQLNPLEEAQAYAALMNERSLTQEELARRLGKSRQHIGTHLSLLKLPPSVQRRVAAGVLTYGHARALVAVKDPWTVERLAARAVAEQLSVRAVEELVALGNLPGWEEDQAPKEPRRRGPRPGPDAARRVAERLESLLDTKVKATGTDRRGRIVIEHGGPEDLERILHLLGVDQETSTVA